ncbi:Zn-dependent hydrolase [Aestuariibacter halophilus]|uniref:Zn-dependent hydrolase n=1 Tax=Fluctibacter halophilus TaxID=226011 RepID=A0ABS8GAV7_9ALTE|nr:Zn-dependent hydrolase [Aestuariibacter halophilus]MCC2616366.1 Zn-dependent hydrolase [Aestuariibacter halophilus]
MADYPHINLSRLQDDLTDLFQIGYNPDTRGVTRLGFTDTDMQARHWLLERCSEAGLHAEMDGAGNVVCRIDKAPANKVVATGSHIDSVIDGGMFDGTLGVLAGIECLRVIKEQGLTLEHPLEVYAFAEEEGRFGGMMGVQALIGDITPQWLMSAHDVNNVYLHEEMRRCGFEPMDALKVNKEPGYFHAYIELHIEQGPVLEKQGASIGVVESISGVFKWIVRLIGKSNHAGTAPMDLRSDAFMGLADFAHEIPRIIDEEGTDKTRLTVGKVELKPGQAHTVPGEAEFTLVGRDVDNDVMKAVADACRRVCSAIARKHNLMFEFEQMSWLDPQPMHPTLIDSIAQRAKDSGCEYLVMPSGAGHDAQHMARVTRAGMIFVPSVGGISHAPDEWTHWQDIERGANLLLHSLLHEAIIK